MTHLDFTLETKEIQSLIDKSVKDDLSKNILTTVFNQLMEGQRALVLWIWLSLAHDDRIFSPTVFERYQRNEKTLLTSMLEMYISGVSTRKVSQVVEEFCGKKSL